MRQTSNAVPHEERPCHAHLDVGCASKTISAMSATAALGVVELWTERVRCRCRALASQETFVMLEEEAWRSSVSLSPVSSSACWASL